MKGDRHFATEYYNYQANKLNIDKIVCKYIYVVFKGNCLQFVLGRYLISSKGRCKIFSKGSEKVGTRKVRPFPSSIANILGITQDHGNRVN